MQRVNEHESASNRKSSRDATVAESRHDLDFRRAGKASLGQPGWQFVEKGSVHVATIQPRPRQFFAEIITKASPAWRKCHLTATVAGDFCVEGTPEDGADF
jgi:hypothetical protein